MNQEKVLSYFTKENLIKFGIVSLAIYIVNIFVSIIVNWFVSGHPYPGGLFDALFSLSYFSPLALPIFIYNNYFGNYYDFYLWFSLRNLQYIFQFPVQVSISLILFLGGLSINFLIATRLTILDSIIGSTTSSATQSTSKNKVDETKDIQYKPMSIGDWLVTYLLLIIPIVNIVMLFVWGFGSNTQPSKANWAKASLIWFAILFVLYIIVFGIILLV